MTMQSFWIDSKKELWHNYTSNWGTGWFLLCSPRCLSCCWPAGQWHPTGLGATAGQPTKEWLQVACNHTQPHCGTPPELLQPGPAVSDTDYSSLSAQQKKQETKKTELKQIFALKREKKDNLRPNTAIYCLDCLGFSTDSESVLH